MSQDAPQRQIKSTPPFHLRVILSKSFVKYEHNLPVCVNEMMFNC